MSALGYVFGGAESRRFPIATAAIVAANAVVYLVTAAPNYLASSSADFIYKLGYIPALLPSPEGAARILTSMFVHADLLHILFNMYFLYVFGRGVEGLLGGSRFLALYLLSGVGAALFHTAAVPVSGPETAVVPAVGASGAISGVLGAYMMFFPRTSLVACFPVFFVPACFTVSASAYLVFWFAMQVIYGYMKIGGVAFFAHAGGFIAGIALAWILGGRRVKELKFFRETLYAFSTFRYIVFGAFARGLGHSTKVLLLILILATSVPLLYYSRVAGLESLMLYRGSVGVNGYADTVFLKVSYDGDYSYVGFSLTDTNIVLLRVSRAGLLVNSSLSNKILSYLDKPVAVAVPIQVQVDGKHVTEIVPVVLYFEATYDENGVVRRFEGVMRTDVVSVTLLYGRLEVRRVPATYRFSIAFDGPYVAESVLIAVPPSFALSLVSAYVVTKKDEELAVS